MLELIFKKEKFNFNRKLLENINENKFTDEDFSKMSQNNIKKITLNSIKDNKRFQINAVELLYSLPINSFTLINDEENKIYLAKTRKIIINNFDKNSEEFNKYINLQNSDLKKDMLQSYDFYLSNKYEIVLNQKTIERVKNFFQ